MTHTAQFGSQIAKNGFKNEQEVVNKFNNWQTDEQAKTWLEVMGYDLAKISTVKAMLGNEAKKLLIEQGHKFDSGNTKTDVRVHIVIYLKDSIEPQNLSVKLVTVIGNQKPQGFNQTDKRRIKSYQAL